MQMLKLPKLPPKTLPPALPKDEPLQQIPAVRVRSTLDLFNLSCVCAVLESRSARHPHDTQTAKPRLRTVRASQSGQGPCVF